jgi:hypothetical protein
MTTKTKKASPWLEIKGILNQCSHNDLIGLTSELYALSKTNKNFLEARFINNEDIIDHYKDLIQKYLAPAEPWKKSQQVSLKDAKKVLSDYKKATGNKIAIIDLMVHYVECGNDFTLQFGDLDEPYYASIESVFESALKLMKTFDDHEVDDFIARLKEVVRKADGIGWGYHDAIEEMMSKAYP